MIRALPDGINTFVENILLPKTTQQQGAGSPQKTFFPTDHLNKELGCNAGGAVAQSILVSLDAKSAASDSELKNNPLVADLPLGSTPRLQSKECLTIANRYSFLLGFITNDINLRYVAKSERKQIYETAPQGHVETRK